MKYLTRDPIDLGELLSEHHNPKSGAIVLFSGETRDYSKEKTVKYLEYESHTELAEKIIEGILKEATEKWNLNSAICIHRLGVVMPLESAVVVITSSPHRKEAYTANQFIIDSVKKNAPIWKKEVFEDDSSNWKEGL
ncbi:MAG: molybdenum cofactor biosynthesis protein MoaE [Leptospiraceae bacterium]|nr:molybdenum cofactor biosynthesis protein MoaE [Leptospiraceae bacterium]